MTPTIRQARREDVAIIVAMLGDDFLGKGRERSEDLAPYLQAFDAIASDPNNTIYVACDPDGAVVGTFQLVYMQGLSLSACKRAEIEAVRVHASVRGQGVGRKMFAWAIEKARNDGCGLMQLTTNKKRTDGQRFYDQLGFEATHVGFKMMF
ncbi:Ribosomal protein S18 acetylase RimI [Cohaesibacter sp. ES.047]|uniref:GNAT family N-acetyltransferase n=1 Tax=Cohaesibacter sp. ES.047 TaxID=1798205 RepID=UPI000BB7546C|nr:GNAT family N-acetyltransferase [Cohaesibacter sp. ES.047]SNY93892.1 Ribosomal protein S18 acetylase RimI [Cohaesibacter sp. ES.047]